MRIYGFLKLKKNREMQMEEEYTLKELGELKLEKYITEFKRRKKEEEIKEKYNIKMDKEVKIETININI